MCHCIHNANLLFNENSTIKWNYKKQMPFYEELRRLMTCYPGETIIGQHFVDNFNVVVSSNPPEEFSPKTPEPEPTSPQIDDRASIKRFNDTYSPIYDKYNLRRDVATTSNRYNNNNNNNNNNNDDDDRRSDYRRNINPRKYGDDRRSDDRRNDDRRNDDRRRGIDSRKQYNYQYESESIPYQQQQHSHHHEYKQNSNFKRGSLNLAQQRQKNIQTNKQMIKKLTFK
jgi:hypothetical protein